MHPMLLRSSKPESSSHRGHEFSTCPTSSPCASDFSVGQCATFISTACCAKAPRPCMKKCPGRVCGSLALETARPTHLRTGSDKATNREHGTILTIRALDFAIGPGILLEGPHVGQRQATSTCAATSRGMNLQASMRSQKAYARMQGRVMSAQLWRTREVGISVSGTQLACGARVDARMRPECPRGFSRPTRRWVCQEKRSVHPGCKLSARLMHYLLHEPLLIKADLNAVNDVTQAARHQIQRPRSSLTANT